MEQILNKLSEIEATANAIMQDAARQKQALSEEAEKQKLLEELKGKENITPDGRKINIYANIGSVGDLGYVMENDAGGIGLFRSEFLYLGRNDFPTDEDQLSRLDAYYEAHHESLCSELFQKITGITET